MWKSLVQNGNRENSCWRYSHDFISYLVFSFESLQKFGLPGGFCCFLFSLIILQYRYELALTLFILMDYPIDIDTISMELSIWYFKGLSVKIAIKSQALINKNFQRNIANIFLPIIFSICFGCSKEPSH